MGRSNEKTTKATAHNKRSNGGKSFNANHNTLECTREMQSHIDQTRFQENVYFRFTPEKKTERIPGGSGGFDSTKHEKKVYQQLFGKGLDARNERYIKNRNKDRCREIKDLYQDPKTAPMETIFQVGNSKTENLTREEMRNAVETAWIHTTNMMIREYKGHLFPLDGALHMEEQVPHIHFRYVFAGQDKDGNMIPNQNQALEAMGFQAGKRTRYDNALIRFTDHLRETFYLECEKLGLQIDRDVVNPSKRQKDILQYQVEQLNKEKDVNQAELYRVSVELERVTRSLERSEAKEKELNQLNNQLTTQVAQLNRQNAVLRYQTEKLAEKTEKQQKEADQTEKRIIRLEEYERMIYGKNHIKRNAEVYEEIPAQQPKMGLGGKQKSPGQPRKYVVNADQFDQIVKLAEYNVKRDYGSKVFQDFKKALETNDVQELNKQIDEQDKQINDLEQKLGKANMQLINHDYYLRQRGLVQDFDRFEQSQDPYFKPGNH